MSIEQLRQDNVFSIFYEICQIPHGSGKEATLSNYLYEWALKRGIEARRDSANNVIMKAKASKGWEEKKPILLQAHMDMVCEKISESAHDFDKDPIKWVVDGDILSTGGETTLGADDGIGIALALALLEDQGWEHPALEIVITTDEEEDFTGVSAVDISELQATTMINLDHVKDDEVLCGSCGGMKVDMRFPLEMKNIEGKGSYCLNISGLRGGHSGEDIHRGRGNANVLLGRVLAELQKEIEYQIAWIKGGSFRLAIPREASAILCLNPEEYEIAKEIVKKMELQFQSELSATRDQVKVSLEMSRSEFEKAADSQKIVTAILLTPDGITQLNESLEGIVDSSDNLGEIYLSGNELHFVLEIRSATTSLREFLFDKMKMITNLLGGTCECADAYPSWDFHPDSELQRLYKEVYRKQMDRELKVSTVHAGLEVGFFQGKNPAIDAISIGPNIWDFHSPSERVSISSTKKVYGCLKSLISHL